MTQAQAPALLARGPWAAEQVQAVWLDEAFVADDHKVVAADAAVAALRDRGSPSHDGIGARLVDYGETAEGGLQLSLQPLRWGLRLVEGDASSTISALCVTRDSEGRWLAGRRAAWLASWAGRWALGAGGAVDVDEDPVEALTRELEEEWSVVPDRFSVEALAKTPNGLILLVGLAWLAPGAEVVADDEHDDHAWWPADVESWPAEADEPLRRMAATLA